MLVAVYGPELDLASWLGTEAAFSAPGSERMEVPRSPLGRAGRAGISSSRKTAVENSNGYPVPASSSPLPGHACELSCLFWAQGCRRRGNPTSLGRGAWEQAVFALALSLALPREICKKNP